MRFKNYTLIVIFLHFTSVFSMEKPCSAKLSVGLAVYFLRNSFEKSDLFKNQDFEFSLSGSRRISGKSLAIICKSGLRSYIAHVEREKENESEKWSFLSLIETSDDGCRLF